MKNYYRLMLGQRSAFAKDAQAGSFVGADFGIDEDISKHLSGSWEDFKERFIPHYLKQRPQKTKVAARLACGVLWRIGNDLQPGDIVLCPNGEGSYLIGEISSNYEYVAGDVLPHRRGVVWHSKKIERSLMSLALRNSTGSINTLSDISKHSDEIEMLIAGGLPAVTISTDPGVIDAVNFVMEKHLEDFLLENWKGTELAKKYDVYTDEDGEFIGRQYPTDTGPIDILAISKDKKELLVIELKKGRASDSVVGQIQRYMGFVNDELLEDFQSVRGIIIALEDDKRIRRALSVATNIDFYRYEVSFKLLKA